MPPIHYMIKFLLITAFLAAFIFIITGKFLDLKIERNKVDMFRTMVNFINYLSASSPLLIKDSNGNLFKSMINETKIIVDNFNNNDWFDSNCCDLNGFNYIYSIPAIDKRNFSDVRSKKDPGINFPYFNPKSYCYQIAGFLKTNSMDSLVNICKSKDDCKLGKAELTITKTPLSEITYWLSRACTTDKLGNFKKNILLDYNDVNYIDLDDNKKEVCIYFMNGQTICKKYACDKDVIKSNVDELSDDDKKMLEPKFYHSQDYSLSASCFSVRVRLEDGKIYFDNLIDQIRPVYSWVAPSTCYGSTLANPENLGNIKWCNAYTVGRLCVCSTNLACSGALFGGVDSDTIYYKTDKAGLGNIIDCRYRYYLPGSAKPNEVSSADVNNHGYIWESFGDKSRVAECCLGTNCNSISEGYRVYSTNLLNENTINNKDVANAFNTAWCGDSSKTCLLCAPDENDPSKTKWYVCSGSSNSYPGMQEVKLGEEKYGYLCRPDGWELK
jgi:hypothetical protein